MAGLADSSGDHITIHGHDLAEGLIGKATFAEMFYLLCFGRLPEQAVARMLDAILVTLAEHGLTPSAIVARLTHLGAPESLQGAIAAGLLGAGSALLGTAEEASLMFRKVTAATTTEARERAIAELVSSSLRSGIALPGFGHSIHREGDQRVMALRSLQLELGLPDDHFVTAEKIGSALSEAKRRPLVMNAAAAVGSIVCDLDLPPRFGRGLALVARTAGLVAHVLEEERSPIAEQVWIATRSGLIEADS